VTVLAWGSLIYGLWKLIVPLLIIGVGGALANWGGTVVAAAGAVAVVIGVLKLVTPVFYLVFSYGAFKMKSWAWPMGLIAPVFGVLGGLWSFANGDSLRHLLLTSVVPVAILAYLLSPGVRRAFGRS
jgi:hypothetical protein